MDDLTLTELRKKCLASLYACTDNISKYLEEKERPQEFNKFKNFVTEYCQMELQEEAGKMAIQSFEVGESLNTNWKSLKNKYEKKLKQCMNRKAKFNTHPFMKELERHIATVESSQGDAEQDVAITEATHNYIDPISKRPITYPVRNTICNHVYDKDSIESIIRNTKNKGCPYFGCTNKQFMLADHLQVDEGLLLTLRGTQEMNQLSQEY